MDNETPKAAEAYAEYEAMGAARSLKRLAAGEGPSGKPYRLASLETWSSKFKWTERVAQRDRDLHALVVAEYQDQRLVAIEEELTTLDEMKRERLSTAKLARELAKLIIQAKMDPALVARQSLKAAVELLHYADQTERLDSGEATSRTEHVSSGSDLFSIKRIDPRTIIEEIAIEHPVEDPDAGSLE